MRILGQLFAGMLLFPFLLYSGNSEENANQVSIRLENFASHMAPHKLYLHFNKDHYNAGDNIWFKAYLIDAITHIPDTVTANIYLDLINTEGVLMGRRILLARNGIAAGDLHLPPSIPDGNYKVRAYTDWMVNFDESFYFTKYLYINNPGWSNTIPRLKVWSNRRFNRQLRKMENSYEAAFFPEGGRIVAGIPARVAFRAYNNLGKGIEASVAVYDDAGEIVQRSETGFSGLGSFEFTPEAGTTYHARVSFPSGRPRSFELPEVRDSGVVMRIQKNNDSVLFDIAGTGATSGGKLMLVAHSMGQPVFSRSFSLADGKYNYSIHRNELPAGISHFFILSSSAEPLTERLLLIDHQHDFHFYPQVITRGENYGLVFEISDKDNNPVSGSFSVSIQAGNNEQLGPHDNLVSYMLLSSDLPGVIENPGQYFISNTDTAAEADRLLILNKWQRFSVSDALSGVLPEMKMPRKGLSLSGRLTEPAMGEVVGNYPVELVLRNTDNGTYKTMTNSRGIFEFDSLFFYDETRADISSKRLKNDYVANIEFFTPDIEGHTYVRNFHTRENRITRRGSNWSRVARAASSPYSETPSTTALAAQYGRPDQVIIIDLNTVSENSIYEVLLRRGRGIQFERGRVLFRGRTDLLFEREPMYMLDGLKTPGSVVLGLSPLDVQRIEIFRGTSKAAFGSEGGSGAILVYSRRAADRGFEDQKEITLTGYHTPNQFFGDPAFSSADEPFNTKTILWDPEVETDNSGRVMIPFTRTSDINELRVVIEGIGFNGGFGSGVFMLKFQN
jgi:hypothetical protein